MPKLLTTVNFTNQALTCYQFKTVAEYAALSEVIRNLRRICTEQGYDVSLWTDSEIMALEQWEDEIPEILTNL